MTEQQMYLSDLEKTVIHLTVLFCFLITAQPLNIRMNLSQVYGSSTAGRIVCRSVCKIASTRFLICRDLLILQQLLMRLGDAVSTA